MEQNAMQAIQTIDINSMLYIHRWDTGYIGFMRKTESGMESIGTLPVRELRSIFPHFQAWLLVDSYFTVNTLYREAPYKVKKTGLPGIMRKENQLKYLNVLYVDLDVGRPESRDSKKRQSWRYAAYKAGVLMDSSIIPQASIIANSGRGIYLIWLLHAKDNPAEPERAFLNRIALYKQINKEINKRLRDLAADPLAIDASRVLRIPGSYHKITANQVKYLIQVGNDGLGFSYSLDELAAFFGIKTTGGELPADRRASQEYGRNTIEKGKYPNRRKGLEVLNQYRVEDLLTIEQHRGGIDKGFRYRTLNLYSEFLTGAGYSKPEMIKALESMAERCNPAYPSESNDLSVKTIVKNTKPRRHRNKTLCRFFGITIQLALELGLKTIIPDELREEIKGKSKREKSKEILLKALRYMVSIYGFGYGCRQYVRALEEIGINTNRTTVNSELKKIALELNGDKIPSFDTIEVKRAEAA